MYIQFTDDTVYSAQFVMCIQHALYINYAKMLQCYELNNIDVLFYNRPPDARF